MKINLLIYLLSLLNFSNIIYFILGLTFALLDQVKHKQSIETIILTHYYTYSLLPVQKSIKIFVYDFTVFNKYCMR